MRMNSQWYFFTILSCLISILSNKPLNVPFGHFSGFALYFSIEYNLRIWHEKQIN